MRCLSLARGLRDRGHRCSFICRKTPGNLIEEIKNSGVEVAECSGLGNYDQIGAVSDLMGENKNLGQEN